MAAVANSALGDRLAGRERIRATTRPTKRATSNSTNATIVCSAGQFRSCLAGSAVPLAWLAAEKSSSRPMNKMAVAASHAKDCRSRSFMRNCTYSSANSSHTARSRAVVGSCRKWRS